MGKFKVWDRVMNADEIVRALRCCNRSKGHRCSECPVFSRYEHRICKATVDRFAADLIETLQAQLAAKEAEIERLREAIASVHKSLDFADSQRQSCKNCTELAINNGLALGRIAVTLKHDFKQPLPTAPEKGDSHDNTQAET